jgi:hypothetical protein
VVNVAFFPTRTHRTERNFGFENTMYQATANAQTPHWEVQDFCLIVKNEVTTEFYAVV